MDMNAVEEIITKQRKWCFKDFLQIKDYREDKVKIYKTVLSSLFSVIGISVVIFAGMVAWSYQPMQDIAALKAEVAMLSKNIEKLTELIANKKMGGVLRMDIKSTCPKCGHRISFIIDSRKRKCCECKNIFVVTPEGLTRQEYPGKEELRRVVINKNPVLDAR